MSQPPAAGEIRDFRGEGPFQVADASVAWEDGPYGGVAMRRTVLARPDYFLDIFLVTCDRPRTMDWIYRNAGACDVSLDLGPVGPTLGDSEGYEHVSGAAAATADEDFTVIWRLNGIGLDLYSAGALGTQVIVGTVPANPASERHPIVINRRRTPATAYISLFHPYTSSPLITSVDWHGRDLLDESWAGCTVQLPDAREGWTIRLAADVDITPRPGPGPVDEHFDYCLD